jgi:hypothetical protein
MPKCEVAFAQVLNMASIRGMLFGLFTLRRLGVKERLIRGMVRVGQPVALDCGLMMLILMIRPEEPSFQKAISWRETA